MKSINEISLKDKLQRIKEVSRRLLLSYNSNDFSGHNQYGRSLKFQMVNIGQPDAGKYVDLSNLDKIKELSVSLINTKSIDTKKEGFKDLIFVHANKLIGQIDLSESIKGLEESLKNISLKENKVDFDTQELKGLMSGIESNAYGDMNTSILKLKIEDLIKRHDLLLNAFDGCELRKKELKEFKKSGSEDMYYELPFYQNEYSLSKDAFSYIEARFNDLVNDSLIELKGFIKSLEKGYVYDVPSSDFFESKENVL